MKKGHSHSACHPTQTHSTFSKCISSYFVVEAATSALTFTSPQEAFETNKFTKLPAGVTLTGSLEPIKQPAVSTVTTKQTAKAAADSGHTASASQAAASKDEPTLSDHDLLDLWSCDVLHVVLKANRVVRSFVFHSDNVVAWNTRLVALVAQSLGGSNYTLDVDAMDSCSALNHIDARAKCPRSPSSRQDPSMGFQTGPPNRPNPTDHATDPHTLPRILCIGLSRDLRCLFSCGFSTTQATGNVSE
ncbi:hypothetical protein FI667_g7495, partial [Globisporangium splendens]